MVYSKSGHSKRRPKLVLKTDYRLMQVKSFAREHSAILSTIIKLPFVFKTYVISIFEWPLKIGFTVSYFQNSMSSSESSVDSDQLDFNECFSSIISIYEIAPLGTVSGCQKLKFFV